MPGDPTELLSRDRHAGFHGFLATPSTEAGMSAASRMVGTGAGRT